MPPSPLDRLDHDRRRLVVDPLADRVQIAERHVHKPGHQRPQALVVLRLGRRGGRTQGAAVETAGERDDLVTFGRRMQPCQLDRRLVRFGSRIAEEGLSVETPLAQHLRPTALRFHVPGVGHVDQRRHLLLHRLDHRRRAMPQQIAAPAGEQVQVPIALAVPHVGTFATHQVDRITDVVRNHVTPKQLDGFRKKTNDSRLSQTLRFVCPRDSRDASTC
jgi:hypothetical protein